MIEAIAVDGEAAIDQAAADAARPSRHGPLVAPDLPAGLAVDRPGVVLRAGDVEHAVDDDRRRFELAGDAGLKRPLRGRAGRRWPA